MYNRIQEALLHLQEIFSGAEILVTVQLDSEDLFRFQDALHRHLVFSGMTTLTASEPPPEITRIKLPFGPELHVTKK
jgi:hypothetical protein